MNTLSPYERNVIFPQSFTPDGRASVIRSFGGRRQ